MKKTRTGAGRSPTPNPSQQLVRGQVVAAAAAAVSRSWSATI
jgi:hypothetical protein